MGEDILKVENLKKYFTTKRGLLHAVDDVSFTLREGNTLGVVGESGCGKSTLGRAIIGLTSITGGKIIFDGRDISGDTGRMRRENFRDMQIIFQDPYSSLDPRKSLYEQIAEPLRRNRVCRTKADLSGKVAELMDTVGLARRLTFSYPHELDGGRRQRIGMARALALGPRFIVCDEPVSALDVSIQAQVLNLLQDLQAEKGLTYVFISHDLSVVKHISNDIMVMYVGRAVEKCAAKELFKYPLHPYTKGLLSAVPIPSRKIKRERIIMQGELTSPINPKPGCRFANRCTSVRDLCHEETPEMQEIMPGHHVACHYTKEINEKE